MLGFYVLFLTLPLSWASLLRDVELQHHVLTTTRQSSLLDCSAACLTDMCCLSFNFFQPTLECQLNYKTKDQSPNDFVQKKGSFYRNKATIPVTLAGVCGTYKCLSCETCRVLPGRNDCVLREGNVIEVPRYRRSGSLSSVTHNCDDVMASNPCTGRYTLTAPEVTNVTVFCDMATLSGGWLVFQKRMDGSEEFYRTWNEYKNGFGDVNREFWLGNEIIHQITSRTVYELRIELEDFEGNSRYAIYSTFSLGSEAENYTLHIGSYSGDAGNALGSFNGVPFSTKDMDLDSYKYSCAKRFHGAWWYIACHSSNLNGWYLRGPTKIYATGVVWSPWKGQYYSLKRSEMKIRPVLV
ncbi:ficolin-2-like isoform X2 [Gigantopelta aegis]|uniref:ficolin-2-like isoform X2 n=1 Tax=Gigantopelta aegis TaxID=1735272 RepID=UPI001B88D732|nr:ficolin-2-like isoform X2 [Gigantopelta aegis]